MYHVFSFYLLCGHPVESVERQCRRFCRFSRLRLQAAPEESAEVDVEVDAVSSSFCIAWWLLCCG